MAEMDDIFNEFARAFVGTINSDKEIASPERLPRDDLDGSLDSLKLVDQYLEHLHQNRKRIDPDAWYTTVLWAGAYVGEVIRHAADLGFFHWEDYNEYMPRHPRFQGIVPERTVSTCAFLVAPDDSMSMPLNKVARSIEEGPENSVHYFACCDISKFKKPA